MHDPIVLAYLAGVIDSDGCIAIHMNTINIRNRIHVGQRPTYVPRLSIGQTHTEAVYLARDTFGGNVHANQPKGNRRLMYTWKIDNCRGLDPALTALIPYLRIKRDRAENALQLVKLKENMWWPKVAVVPGEPLITASEFARRVGIGRATVGLSTAKGTTPSVKVGRANMIPESFLAEYLRRKAIGLTRRHTPEVCEQMHQCYLKSRALNGIGLAPNSCGPRRRATIPPGRLAPADCGR